MTMSCLSMVISAAISITNMSQWPNQCQKLGLKKTIFYRSLCRAKRDLVPKARANFYICFHVEHGARCYGVTCISQCKQTIITAKSMFKLLEYQYKQVFFKQSLLLSNNFG